MIPFSKIAILQRLYTIAEGSIRLTGVVEKTAEDIRSKSNIKLFDSLHLATAVQAGIGYFITREDKLLKQATRLNLEIQLMSPGEWFEKEGKYN